MRSYSFLQQEYSVQVFIFSESEVIQEMGKEYGIRVIPTVELIFVFLFILERTNTISQCFQVWQGPLKKRQIPPFMPM